MDVPRRGEVLVEVAKEVLDSQGQQAVEEDVGCGDIEHATRAVAQGVDFSVMDRKIDPERARVVYVLLGFDPSRLDATLACPW